jgi:hypothetical protein
MVQPIHRSLEGSSDLDPTQPPPPPPAPPRPVPRDASQIPDLSHPTGARRGAAPSRPTPLAGARPAALSPSEKATIQARLDAYMASTKPTYRTPLGDVTVPTPFRLAGHPVIDTSTHESLCDAGRLAQLTAADVVLLNAGRASPKKVQSITQTLITLHGIPASSANGNTDPMMRVRQLMMNYGIGSDCAGHVRQEFIAAHPNASVRWRSPENENLSGLASRGFVRIPLGETDSGDLVILRSPWPGEPGHTAIVYDARPATPEDRDRLRALTHGYGEPGRFADSPALRVLVLDSSWGASSDATRGGSQRVTFYQDQASGDWLWLYELGNTYGFGKQLYDHEIEGVYRPAGGP